MNTSKIETVLRFIKLAGYWFVHLPDYEGEPEDLVMVSGADVMCDLLDTGDHGMIHVEIRSDISDNNETDWHKLEFIKSDVDGADYHVSGPTIKSLDIWLCNVTKYVLGKFPAELYVRTLDNDLVIAGVC